jgi:hypothetical protein
MHPLLAVSIANTLLDDRAAAAARARRARRPERPGTRQPGGDAPRRSRSWLRVPHSRTS